MKQDIVYSLYHPIIPVVHSYSHVLSSDLPLESKKHRFVYLYYKNSTLKIYIYQYLYPSFLYIYIYIYKYLYSTTVLPPALGRHGARIISTRAIKAASASAKSMLEPANWCGNLSCFIPQDWRETYDSMMSHVPPNLGDKIWNTQWNTHVIWPWNGMIWPALNHHEPCSMLISVAKWIGFANVHQRQYGFDQHWTTSTENGFNQRNMFDFNLPNMSIYPATTWIWPDKMWTSPAGLLSKLGKGTAALFSTWVRLENRIPQNWKTWKQHKIIFHIKYHLVV